MQVGLDINVVAHSAWQAAPLQFVAGLGPRKAQLLSRAVQREEVVQTRSDLYKGLGILGKHVFRRALLQQTNICSQAPSTHDPSMYFTSSTQLPFLLLLSAS